MKSETTHVFIMARGKGTRLHPLTNDTCKPSVFFGGQYRIIDFVLSNLVQSEIDNVTVLLPTDSSRLSSHLQEHWSNVHRNTSTTHGPRLGNATSVLRALEANLDNSATHIGIFPSDQVFHFDLRNTLIEHLDSGSNASILTRWCRSDLVSNFGVLKAQHNTIMDFIEKPHTPPDSYIHDNKCRVNMGIYWFKRETLLSILIQDEQNALSSNDFGHDVLPLLIKQVSTHMIDIDVLHPWQDVGTIESYWQTHWKYQFDLQGWNIQPTISGSILSSGYTGSPIPCTTRVDQCIIFDNVNIGDHCTLQKMIIDAGCTLDSHLNISPETPIEGTVYRTAECLIIPKNSIVKYNQNRQIITVEQP